MCVFPNVLRRQEGEAWWRSRPSTHSYLKLAGILQRHAKKRFWLGLCNIHPKLHWWCFPVFWKRERCCLNASLSASLLFCPCSSVHTNLWSPHRAAFVPLWEWVYQSCVGKSIQTSWFLMPAEALNFSLATVTADNEWTPSWGWNGKDHLNTTLFIIAPL